MYDTTLINFGHNLYSGANIHEALAAAEKSGFESSVRYDGILVAVFSPISGWKTYQ